MTATTNQTTEVSIDELWESAPTSEQTFNPTSLTHLPEVTRRYLEHAIAPGAKLSSAVRVRWRSLCEGRRCANGFAESITPSIGNQRSDIKFMESSDF